MWCEHCASWRNSGIGNPRILIFCKNDFGGNWIEKHWTFLFMNWGTHSILNELHHTRTLCLSLSVKNKAIKMQEQLLVNQFCVANPLSKTICKLQRFRLISTTIPWHSFMIWSNFLEKYPESNCKTFLSTTKLHLFINSKYNLMKFHQKIRYSIWWGN